MSKKKKEKKLSVREQFGLLKYFLKTAWQANKGAVLWLFLGKIPYALIPFISMIFPKLIIDELIGVRRVSALAALVLTMITVEILLRFVNRYVEMRVNMGKEWFDNYMERSLSAKSMKIEFAMTENPKSMDLYQKAINGRNDSGGINGILQRLADIWASLLTMTGVVSIISVLSPFLLLASVLVVVINMFLTSRQMRVNLYYFNLWPKLYRILDYVFDTLSDFSYGKDIRLYDGMDMVTEMGQDTSNEIYSLMSQRSNKVQVYSFLSVLVNAVDNAFIYGYLGILAILGRITIGDFTMLMNAAETFSQDCMSQLIACLQDLGNNLELLEGYHSFMGYPEETQEGEQLPKEAMAAPLFEFRDVSFRYPETEQDILRHVNLTVMPGEHICVVGENGAGKSTFIKLLCRLYPVTEGDILLNGKSIYSYGMSEYRKILSVVFQDFKLFSFSIRDNLLMAAGAEELADARLNEVCTMAGFGDRLSQLPKGLDTGLYKNFYEDGVEPSGGEAQKLAIARALCKSAPVVILDEPTAALDPLAEAEIYEHFQEMSKGRTAIFISHRLSSCQFCDRVVVFAKHGIAESGPHKELVKRPDGIYAAMFRAQAENYQ